MAENDVLTTTQTRAIAALLSERDVRSAAQAARVKERTLWRWLADPDFKAELTRQEGAVLDQATRSLLAMQGKALEVFDVVLSDPSARDSDRIRAAQSVLEFLLKLRELNTLEARIAALEAKTNEQP